MRLGRIRSPGKPVPARIPEKWKTHEPCGTCVRFDRLHGHGEIYLTDAREPLREDLLPHVLPDEVVLSELTKENMFSKS